MSIFSLQKKILFLVEVHLIYNVVLISAVQQSDSFIHTCTYFFIFFSIMIYHRILNIALLYYTVQYYIILIDYTVDLVVYSVYI